MFSERSLKILVLVFLALIPIWVALISPFFNRAQASSLPVSVVITVCGNGVIEEGEICDDGGNNGNYAYHQANRYCNDVCDGWAPYCGDGNLQTEYGEECDDGNNISGDGCSASCETEESYTPPSGGGGGGGVFVPPSVETKVVLKGKAYPGSEVNILKDGELLDVVVADSSADFDYQIEEISAGVYTFGVWAKDENGIKSITYTLTFEVTSKTVTTVSGIFLPPTIGFEKSALTKGEILNIFGQTVPEAEVSVHVFSDEVVATTTSDEIGGWLLPFDTSVLKEGSHIAKARFLFNSYEKSGFSNLRDFYLGKVVPSGMNQKCPYADLNNDGRVNLVDFSILLYWWGEENECVDQNMSGTVDLTDFSIMMFYWTG